MLSKKEKYMPVFWLHSVGGICYKRDFYSLISSLPHKGEIYRSLLDEEYISEYEIVSEEKRTAKREGARDTATVVSLTRDSDLLGRLSRIYEEPSFLVSIKSLKQEKMTGEKSTRTYRESLYPLLNEASTEIMFHLAGVRTAKKEKPSLCYLRSRIVPPRNVELVDEELRDRSFIKEGYLDQRIDDFCSYTENGKRKIDYYRLSKLLKEYIKSGLYYSKAEFREYDRFVHGPSGDDSYKNAKWQGIFFNEGTCLVTMILASSQNTRLKLYKASLENLNQKLDKLVIEPFSPHVKRNIAGFSNLMSDTNTVYQHGINCLFIALSNTMVPTMTVGAKGGVLHSKTERNLSLRNTSSDVHSVLLDYRNPVYGMIFVVVKSDDGIRHLRYITSSSVERWRAESARILEMSNRVSEDRSLHFDSITVPEAGKNVSFYPGIHSLTGYECIYMPVYEIKLLSRIYELGTRKDLELLVLADHNMHNFISHSIRLGNSEGLKGEVQNHTDVKFADLEPRNTRFRHYGILDPIEKISEEVVLDYSLSQFSKAKITNTAYTVTGLSNLKEFFIYDSLGNVDGRKKFDRWLSKKNLVADYGKCQKKKLITFFNMISTGELTLENAYGKVASEYNISFRETDPKEKKRERLKSITFNVTTSEYRVLAEEAEKEHMTLSGYVKKLTLETLSDDIIRFSE